MGLSFGKIWEKFLGKKEMRILMVGLDAAGASARRVFVGSAKRSFRPNYW